MADSCVSTRRCSTYEPGWLNGPHPSVADGAVKRKVCFHWGRCCTWSTFITVRNCGEFYVYKLKPLKRCGRYCGNGLVPVSAPSAKPVTLQTKAVNKVSSRKVPTTKQTLIVTTIMHSSLATVLGTEVYSTGCSSYTFLNESNRAKTYYDSNTLLCDRELSGWYRFGGEAGNLMADSCVSRRHCGTGLPGWLQGSHPSVADGVVRRKVCFQWSDYCCPRSTMIDVRNCGWFYVYKLKPPPVCNSRYCGNGLPYVSECSNYGFLSESNRAKTFDKVNLIRCDSRLSECSSYTFLNESNRAKTYYDSNTLLCDEELSGWYRFGGEAGNQMADSCVSRRHCGAGMPGWLDGSHPSMADGVVRRKVCFQWLNYCCQRITAINVRNCGRFYVYKLKKPPVCNARYCGNGLPSVSECSNHKFLNESNRAKTYQTTGSALSDTTLVSGWYRFGGEAGNQMAESCVNTQHCGTNEPG
ncbi:hypothetical protein ACROYT_G020131 [Oculina patagonica]